MLEQVKIGGNIVVEFIKKGVATLQLSSAKPCKHGSACSNTMATCEVSFERWHLVVLLHCTNWQPSLSLIERVASFL